MRKFSDFLVEHIGFMQVKDPKKKKIHIKVIFNLEMINNSLSIDFYKVIPKLIISHVSEYSL